MAANLTVKRGWYTICSDGTILGKAGQALRPYAVKGGYLRVSLYLDGVRRHHLVHVIVAGAFIGPRPPGHEVNHRDGDKTNNAASNLEYLTPSENVRHSLDVLRVRRARGEANSRSGLTDQIVREIRQLYASGEPVADIAARFGIDRTHVWRIATRRAWGHVS